jgi:uncharacterized membrane protein
MNRRESTLTNGPAAAAFFAAGIGSFILGVLTTLKANIKVIKSILAFYAPTGPLSGQTTLAVTAWLLAWVMLHLRWKEREVDFGKVFIITMVLVVLGLIGTFPPFFEVFEEIMR